MESDISQLEAPTFTTLSSRGPPEPMVKLQWNHKVSLIGEKVLNPMIHCCDQCEKPILIYGRMIPCKHVFCLKCAREEPLKVCPRCKEKVLRVEQSGLGTVFMCTHGGTRYGNIGCRRTYLSQRDLQAHINHRHVNSNIAESKQQPETKTSNVVQRNKPIEQATNRPTTRQPPQFVSSITSVPSSASSNPSIARNNTIPSNVVPDSQLQSQPQQQQQQQPLMMGNMNVHQQPQMTTEMYYNTPMAQQQQYGGYANPGQQQNPSSMQPNYGSMHQPPGMSMMMAQQAVHMSRPPPPQGPAYFSQYGQPYGQMPQHYPNSRQYEQQNFNPPPNAQQWNQQQYYR